jgi:hypothetical protein
MFVGTDVSDEITKHLAWIQLAIKMKGSIGFNDDKIRCEKFFLGLFNKLYNLELINVNSISTAYPAIDLGDKKTGTCYQITFENTADKISKTRETYKKHKIFKDYPKLIIFIYDKKPGKRIFDEGVQYLEDITKHIEYDTDDKKKKEILDYLKTQWTLLKETKKSIEIQTIYAVIEHLSRDEKSNSFTKDLEDKPYPAEKLQLRFGEFRECVEEEYGELYPEHSSALDAAKSDHIDEGNSKKIKNHLRRISREKLFDKNNDAKMALESLIDDIRNDLSFEVYDGALRFYILSELMECDIFPLSKKEASLLSENNDNSI